MLQWVDDRQVDQDGMNPCVRLKSLVHGKLIGYRHIPLKEPGF